MKPQDLQSTPNHKAQLAAFQPGLVLLALFLIDQGITAGELQSAVSEIFVKAAGSRARMKNGRVNQSRVAAMTGFTRTEVRRLMNVIRDGDASTEVFGARRVLEGWNRDPEFLTRSGKPRKLPLRGGHGTFTKLAKKYSADVPPRATLDELRRLKAVVVSNGFASQQSSMEADARRRSQNISRAAAQLKEIFQAMGYPEEQSPTLFFAGDAVLDASENSMNRIIKRRVEQNTKAFLGGLESAASAFTKKRNKGSDRKQNRILVRVSLTQLSPGK